MGVGENGKKLYKLTFFGSILAIVAVLFLHISAPRTAYSEDITEETIIATPEVIEEPVEVVIEVEPEPQIETATSTPEADLFKPEVATDSTSSQQAIIPEVPEEIISPPLNADVSASDDPAKGRDLATLTPLPENQNDWTGSDDPAFVIDEHFFSTELVPVSVTGPDEIFLPTQAVTEFPQENIQNENLISNALSAFTGFMRMLFGVRLAKADSLPEASVLNSLGEIDKNIVPLIAMIDGKTVIKLDRGRAFRPGAYTLVVNYENKIIKRDFTWGVLAINTNKATYTIGEEAHIQMAALNKHGHTLCNSKLELQITNITNGSN